MSNFDLTEEMLEPISETEFLEALETGRYDFQQGRSMSASESVAELRSKYGLWDRYVPPRDNI